MKLKKEIFILAAVIIGLSIYLATRKPDRALYELPKLPPMSGSETTRIEIGGPRANLVLHRDGGKWTVGSEKYPAAKSKVQQIIDTIEGLTLTELISSSGDTVRYDLTEDQRIHVKAWAGDTLQREFTIGKTAPSNRHTFVQISANPNVYNALDNFRGKFDQQVAEIRDKQVLSFPSSEIQQIRLTKGADALVLVRQAKKQEKDPSRPTEEPASAPVKAGTLWQTSDGVQADSARIDRMLSTLSQLNCDSFVADRSKADFSTPIYHIRIKGSQGYELAIFEKLSEDADKHPATSSQNEYPFFLPDWRIKDLMPEFAELLQASESKSPPE
jgi:hypothetical protein